MAKRDYYEVLGIEKNADDDAIKKAYRKLAMMYHPDKNKDNKDAEEKFKEACEAYEVLSDKDKRARYDQYGHAGMEGAFGSGGFRWEDFTHQGDFSDIFGGFESIFSQFFGGGGSFRSGGGGGQPRGEDLRIELSLNLKEIYEGVTKTIKINVKDACTTCNGSGSKDGITTKCTQCGGHGQVRVVRQSIFGNMQTVSTCPSCRGEGTIVKNKCTACNGEGRVSQSKSVDINIPKGVAEGQYVREKGKGNAAPRGGVPGDILVEIREKEDDFLKRDGANLFCEYPITFTQAALGDEVLVPTITKKIKLKIPAGTQSGKMFKISGQGLPVVQSALVGDFYVQIKVVTPTNLSAEEIKILEQFKVFDSKRDLNIGNSIVDKIKGFFKN
ncbi:MAG: molecular chaperone DnaJ [Candidatus Cloacimonetes bacterium]|nr:molecular chaperone DnaJ [Candidatus Cloacimonadota bacterium]